MNDLKSGWKTTEFWLSLLALLVGALMSGGYIAETSPWSKPIGVISMALAAAGYGHSRGVAKAGALVLFMLLPGLGVGCSVMPEGVMASNAGQVLAWDNAETNYKLVINTYHKSLMEAYNRQLELILDVELGKKDSLTPDQVKAIVAMMDAQRKEFTAKLEAKRDEFLAIETFAVGRELTSVTTKYLELVDDTQKNIQEVFQKIKGIVKK